MKHQRFIVYGACKGDIVRLTPYGVLDPALNVCERIGHPAIDAFLKWRPKRKGEHLHIGAYLIIYEGKS